MTLVPHADVLCRGVGPLAQTPLGLDDRLNEELADIRDHDVHLAEGHLDGDFGAEQHGLVDGSLELTRDLGVAGVIDLDHDADLLVAVVLVLDDELVRVLLQRGADQRTAGLAGEAEHAEVAGSRGERDLDFGHVLDENETFHRLGSNLCMCAP